MRLSHSRFLLSSVPVCMACCLATSNLFADSYTLSDIAYPGASFTQAGGVNDAGQVVGLWDGGGFLFNQGTYTLLIDPSTNYNGPVPTNATGINSAGEIVGGYRIPFASVGFLYQDGTWSDISFPSSASTVARGINASGLIVGNYTDSTGNSQGFLLNAGQYSTISLGTDTYLSGINNEGIIVGSSGSSGVVRTPDGSLSTINFPGAQETSLASINNFGEILGDYTLANGSDHCFTFQDGAFTSLDSLGLTDCNGLNDSGQFVGVYFPSPLEENGFLATPIPEPAIVPLLFIGLVFLVIQYRRGAYGCRV